MDEASSSDSGGARESFSSSEGSADEAAWSADVDEAHRALGLEALVWRGIPRARRRREWVRLSGALDLARSDGCVDEGGDGGRGEPRLLPPPLLRRDVDAATAERRLVSAVSPAARADVECDVPRSGERRPRRAPLRRVLLAYAARSQRVGYCQGLDVVAASILREVGGDEAYAFWLLAALVERRCEGWWDANLVRLRRDVGRVTAARHAKVAALVERDVPLDLILVQWLLSLFGHVGNDYTARSVRARTLDVALCAPPSPNGADRCGARAVLALALAVVDVADTAVASDVVAVAQELGRSLRTRARRAFERAHVLYDGAALPEDGWPGDAAEDADGAEASTLWLRAARRLARQSLEPLERASVQCCPGLAAFVEASVAPCARLDRRADAPPAALVASSPKSRGAARQFVAHLLGGDLGARLASRHAPGAACGTGDVVVRCWGGDEDDVDAKDDDRLVAETCGDALVAPRAHEAGDTRPRPGDDTQFRPGESGVPDAPQGAWVQIIREARAPLRRFRVVEAPLLEATLLDESDDGGAARRRSDVFLGLAAHADIVIVVVDLEADDAGYALPDGAFVVFVAGAVALARGPRAVLRAVGAATFKLARATQPAPADDAAAASPWPRARPGGARPSGAAPGGAAPGGAAPEIFVVAPLDAPARAAFARRADLRPLARCLARDERRLMRLVAALPRRRAHAAIGAILARARRARGAAALLDAFARERAARWFSRAAHVEAAVARLASEAQLAADDVPTAGLEIFRAFDARAWARLPAGAAAALDGAVALELPAMLDSAAAASGGAERSPARLDSPAAPSGGAERASRRTRVRPVVAHPVLVEFRPQSSHVGCAIDASDGGSLEQRGLPLRRVF